MALCDDLAACAVAGADEVALGRRLQGPAERLWSGAMGGKADRYFIPALVGFAPLVLALLTSRPGVNYRPEAVTLIDALPVVLAELVAVAVALRRDLMGWFQENEPPTVAAIALACWVAIAIGTTVLVSPAAGTAGTWTLHWIVHLMFGFSIAFLCSRTLRARDFTLCFQLGFLLYVPVLVAFFIRHWGQPIDWVHDLPAAPHIRHVGIYAAAMTGMSIGAMATARDWRGRALAFAVAAVGFALGLWTGSRGMALSVAGATAVGALLLPAMRSVKLWGAAALALAIGIAAVAWLPVPNDQMMGVARTVAATTEHEVTTGRVQIWMNVVQAVARHPVFGYGSGQMVAVAPFSDMGQPHNLILQILLDWGLAGFACIIIIAFYYVRRAWPELRSRGEELAAPFMGAASLFLLSMIDAALFHVLPVALFATFAGMLAARRRSDEQGRQASGP